MLNETIFKQLAIGSIASIIGTICYIIAISVPTTPQFGFLLITIWPVTAIIFAFSVYQYIALDRQSISNQLAFLFTIIAFVLVYIMMSVQVGLKTGIGDAIALANNSEQETLKMILSSTAWVHLGIDLAWDMFLGISLVFLSLAIKRHPRFGIWWTIPMVFLGLSVMLINLYTFPYTPVQKGLFDIGPVIGTFMIMFAARMAHLGFKRK